MVKLKCNEVFDIIRGVICKYPTDAIYVFGSYLTDYFDEYSSDIDIAWFTDSYTYIDNVEFIQDTLSDMLEIQVNVVNGFSLPFKFLKEVLSGEIITTQYSYKFQKFFEDFYDTYHHYHSNDENLLFYYDDEY